MAVAIGGGRRRLEPECEDTESLVPGDPGDVRSRHPLVIKRDLGIDNLGAVMETRPVTILLLLMAQAMPAPAPSPAPDDIVVVGERMKQLRRLRMTARRDRRTGRMVCVFKRRSGDPQLDAGICSAALACTATVASEAEIVPCIRPAMEALVPDTPWLAGRAAR